MVKRTLTLVDILYKVLLSTKMSNLHVNRLLSYTVSDVCTSIQNLSQGKACWAGLLANAEFLGFGGTIRRHYGCSKIIALVNQSTSPEHRSRSSHLNVVRAGNNLPSEVTMPASPTPAQSETSRLNGARSCCFLCASMLSALNGTRHGLRGRTFVILPDEDPAEWLALLDGYLARFRPADAAETRCVERLAACDWREDRLERLEAETLFAGRGDTREPDPRLDWSRTLPRYKAAIRRDREAALEQLDTLRASARACPTRRRRPTPPGCAGWPTGSSAGSRRHPRHPPTTRPNPSRSRRRSPSPPPQRRPPPRTPSSPSDVTPEPEPRPARTGKRPRPARRPLLTLSNPAAPATATVRPSPTAAGALPSRPTGGLPCAEPPCCSCSCCSRRRPSRRAATSRRA